MLVILFAFLVAINSASAAPSPWSGGFAGAYAGPGIGVYTGTGFWPFGGFPFGWSWPVFIPSTPWYKGPNVCKEKKVLSEPEELKEWFQDGDTIGFSRFQHQSNYCRGNNNKYVCMKRVIGSDGAKIEITKYECCHGFVRNSKGPGCVESSGNSEPSQSSSSGMSLSNQMHYTYVGGSESTRESKIDLRYLMPTLRNMGATEMVDLIEKVGMADDFHANNYTLFCPPNSLLEAFGQNLEGEIDNEIRVKYDHQKLKKKTRLYNLLVSHLSRGFLKMDNLMDNYLLPTENEKTQIRINIYFIPDKVVTVNCVPTVSEDNFARNGIIHTVKKILPTPSKTVADIIAGDFQFSILKRMLSVAGLVQTLRNPNGSFTMFAPTDSAIASALNSHDGDDSRCATNIMKHHIIEHVICSSALHHHARSLNMIGELLTLTRDKHNKLYVDGVQIVVRDLMATNGVVHVIDGLLSTQQTKPVSQVMKESGLNEFLSLLEESNLKSEFDSMKNVMYFIPTDEVLQGVRSISLKSYLSHNESILDILRFHVAEGEVALSSTDQLFPTKIENSTLRIQIHITYPQRTPQILVQCASILSADIKICGGTLHVVDKLLLPPKYTILEFLENAEGFSTLVLLLRATGLDFRLDNDQSAFTLLAPTDDAFHNLGEATLFRILQDIDRATDLVKMHIMLGSVCCSHLKSDLSSGRRQTRAMDGSLLTLDRSLSGVMMVGGAHMVDCDIMAKNGVVHIMDTVLSQNPLSLLGSGYADHMFMFR